jgi:glutaminyl-peptide cyclotransferase
MSERIDEESVLDGVGYDAQGDRVLVTGKQWPFVFQIRAAGGLSRCPRGVTQ